MMSGLEWYHIWLCAWSVVIYSQLLQAASVSRVSVLMREREGLYFFQPTRADQMQTTIRARVATKFPTRHYIYTLVEISRSGIAIMQAQAIYAHTLLF